MHLDEKLNFSHHINKKIAKANKSIGIICKLAHVLPRQSLMTIYKSFIWPLLDYGGIIYDQPNNESFCNLIERLYVFIMSHMHFSLKFKWLQWHSDPQPQSLKLQILRLFQAKRSLMFRQLWSVDSLWNAYVTW